MKHAKKKKQSQSRSWKSMPCFRCIPKSQFFLSFAKLLLALSPEHHVSKMCLTPFPIKPQMGKPNNHSISPFFSGRIFNLLWFFSLALTKVAVWNKKPRIYIGSKKTPVAGVCGDLSIWGKRLGDMIRLLFTENLKRFVMEYDGIRWDTRLR